MPSTVVHGGTMEAAEQLYQDAVGIDKDLTHKLHNEEWMKTYRGRGHSPVMLHGAVSIAKCLWCHGSSTEMDTSICQLTEQTGDKP